MPIYGLGDVRPRVHPSAYVHPDASIIGDVEIGPDASIWPRAVLRGDYGSIRVGARTSIQDGTVIHATADHPTNIGADCVVGHNAHLEGCTIRDRVLVGSGSITLSDVVAESGAVIAAGAVLREGTLVPTQAMARGVPAIVVPDAVRNDLVEAGVLQYVANARRYRAALVRLDSHEMQ